MYISYDFLLILPHFLQLISIPPGPIGELKTAGTYVDKTETRIVRCAGGVEKFHSH